MERGPERTLSWRGGDGDKAPDSIRISAPEIMPPGTSGSYDSGTVETAVLNLYAGRIVGVPADNGDSGGGPSVLLKEYRDEAGAALADAEVEAYMRLYSPNEDGARPYPSSLPVVPLIAFFASQSINDVEGGGSGASLWTVQEWGGLQRLAGHPDAKQRGGGSAPWWPPMQRVRDTAIGARHRYLRNAMHGMLAAVACIHTRGVCHNAIDAGSFLVTTLDDLEADDLEVRLMNLGFASPFTPEGQRADMRACALALAELVFSSLSQQGASERTSAAAMRRLFEGVFNLDMANAREYCVEAPEWEPVVEFFDQGDGWALLGDMIGGGGAVTAAELLERSRRVTTPYD